ncbi:MAG: ornithine--oxo-acid transaminase [Deltaproteobacteria bacterium]|nr:ornithine--oxo-acid transaminase [Deltaproteobacteria bacterium]
MSKKAAIQKPSLSSEAHIELCETYGAHNYHPLPVVLVEGDGVWVTDVEGKRYMDMLAAYSAVNFGHGHEAIVLAAKEQLTRVTLTSRAFYNDQIGPFFKDMCELTGMEAILPMNTGAEGVETAIKTARKWGYVKKKIPDGKAKIICCSENFHGRTTTIISFSTDPSARGGFGPYTPGFEIVKYGDAKALAKAVDANTAAFLVEPIQGEAGIVVPPAGYLKEVRKICSDTNTLFIADEIQSGLGRTGTTFAVEHEGVRPDMFIIGKAIGGGIMPLSCIATSRAILDVIKPGEHGSTFGGNPLACAIGRKVIAILKTGEFQKNARDVGEYLFGALTAAKLKPVKEIRGRGLWVGIVIKDDFGKARPYCEKLMREGLLCKETHDQIIRLAPPLCITKKEADWAVERLTRVLGS